MKSEQEIKSQVSAIRERVKGKHADIGECIKQLEADGSIYRDGSLWMRHEGGSRGGSGASFETSREPGREPGISTRGTAGTAREPGPNREGTAWEPGDGSAVPEFAPRETRREPSDEIEEAL